MNWVGERRPSEGALDESGEWYEEAELVPQQSQLQPPQPAAGAERRNRSPYYYADLFRERDEPEPPPPPLPAPSLRRQQQGYRKCVSLDAAAPSCPASQQRPSGAAGARAYRKSASLDATPLAALLLEAPPSTHQQQQPAPQPGGHAPMPPQHRRVAAYQQVASCSCAGGSATEEPGQPQPQQATPPLGDDARFSDSDADLDDEYLDMSGQPRARRHIYETAFDCRVDRAAATDDTEDIDRLSNHPALHGFSKPSATPAAAAPGVVSLAPRAGPSDDPSGLGIFTPKDLRRRVHQRRVTLVDDTSLSRDLDSLDLDEDDEDESRPATAAAGAAAGAVGAAPSPPSTAPLPAKFSKPPGAGAGAASGARSAPCLPASAPESGTTAGRLKDARLPVKSLRAREGRPAAGSKFSSTESMATSSSGGSLESIRSSTSEGNRSTSSSDSRRSTSLSSHSSDSSGADSGLSGGVGGGMGRFSNKLHILSPISDKSSQEPASSTETSDNNRNNNSTRASPEDQGGITPTNETNTNTNTNTNNIPSPRRRFAKRQRAPQNRNLINLMGLHQSSGEAEVQGSDSGISIESRTGHQHPGDFSELPFDMPKLRRRQRQLQLQQQQLSDASSVDLADLPFDMPKLRRRMRNSLGAGLALSSADAGSTESSASSSQGGRRDSQGVSARPGLSLNLGGGDASSSASPLRRPALSLDLPAGVAAQPGSIDVSLPLERQGWYHGALSRVEAENVLRVLREGSYLVRNSESARHDYSLSLKGARGFMHMRIQQNKESGKFILGQFSKPFDNIPEMIQHYTVNQLPIRGAEHMCLLHPVIEQLL
ncbi:SH2 domain-containing adapter protein B [Schistocerca americana]|uniref:SH2 domain-containing adapter protein B n=1 Tax=Schistocerca americana TaxID=7009 RepID=UPI001F503D1F|nr:SH2 domain-containing adapter protein B [Schistocerca americana]